MEGQAKLDGLSPQEIWAQNLPCTTPVVGDGLRTMSPPMERGDGGAGRGWERPRERDREGRERWDQEAQTGTGTGTQYFRGECTKTHREVDHRDRSGGWPQRVGPLTVGRGGEKRREEGRGRVVLSPGR